MLWAILSPLCSAERKPQSPSNAESEPQDPQEDSIHGKIHRKSDLTHRKHPRPPPSITMPQMSAGWLHPGLPEALRVSGAHLPAILLRHLPRVSAGLGSRESSASLGSGKHFLEHHTPQSISSSPQPPKREGGKGKPKAPLVLETGRTPANQPDSARRFAGEG